MTSRRTKRANKWKHGTKWPLFDSPLASLRCVEKVRFTSRREAKDFARRRGLAQEPYSCPGCSGFHLTKKRPRPEQ